MGRRDAASNDVEKQLELRGSFVVGHGAALTDWKRKEALLTPYKQTDHLCFP